MAVDSSPRSLAEPRSAAEFDWRNAESADFLHRSGLLFEINRTVLHPLGLALGFEADEATGGAVGPLRLVDSRHDPEGMVYPDEILRSGLERLRAYGVAAIRAERKERLGFMVQPLPGERPVRTWIRRAWAAWLATARRCPTSKGGQNVSYQVRGRPPDPPPMRPSA
jgi:hypothetical protein